VWEVGALGFPKKMVAKIHDDGTIWSVDALGLPAQMMGKMYDK